MFNPIIDSKIESTRSIIKNSLIANVLYRTNMIESFGTGFTRVFELC
jgi:predicted HTH transcriptional regulator